MAGIRDNHFVRQTNDIDSPMVSQTPYTHQLVWCLIHIPNYHKMFRGLIDNHFYASSNEMLLVKFYGIGCAADRH